MNWDHPRVRPIEEVTANLPKPDNRIPFDDAVRQVAEATNRSVEEIAELARRMQAGKLQIGTPMTNGRAAYSVGLGTALAVAAQHERAKAAQDKLTEESRDPLAGVRYAAERIRQLHGVRPVLGPGKCPSNPKDRRTIRIAGKPKHYVQHGDELVLKDGESPWN